MRVVKILNNNYILVEDPNGNECIVMGKGLRFSNQVGSELKEENIQKIFALKDKKSVRDWQQMLEGVSEDYGEAIHSAIMLADEAMPGKLNSQVFIILFDHLIFALERQHKNIILQNRLLWEVRQFYPAEFALGKRMIEYLNQRLQIKLPEEEAGNIAFHLVNAQTENPNMEQTIQAVKMLKDIFNIVQYSFVNRIRTDSIHYTRFVTHMQFFLQRVLEHKMLSGDELDIFEQVAKGHPESYCCARKIGAYIQGVQKEEISREELLYLTIHIARIVLG
ncbi:MAG: PRD domain-containing protein [Lachnospiraceae bacterium]|jgi:beta-glucoside operon transcriptional antiterminator|nr:PRD domain-containing protein [Lachnospiraceae bacterium]